MAAFKAVTATDEKEEVISMAKKYELVGENHNVREADGKIRKAEKGDVFELTPAQAENFADKFKPVA